MLYLDKQRLFDVTVRVRDRRAAFCGGKAALFTLSMLTHLDSKNGDKKSGKRMIECGVWGKIQKEIAAFERSW